MFKKISIIFSLSFISQILSFFAVSYIVKKNATDSFLETIALLDSSYLLINTLISFGIVQLATRELAISNLREVIINKTQNSRINFSILLSLFGLIFFLFSNNSYFLLFIFSPIISLNINYFFYAIGTPEIAVKNSSYRLIGMSLILILFGLFNFFSSTLYFLIYILGILYIAYSSYKSSNSNLYFKLDINFYKDYSKSIFIGITDLAIIFLEFGILFFAAFFYKENVIAEAYILLKIITLIKGVQRMVFLINYNKLIDNSITLILDKIIFFIGFSFYVISFFFSKEILIILFSKQNEQLIINFHVFSISLLLASILLATSARALIIKKDRIYILSYITSLILSFLFMVLLSHTNYFSYGISISIFIGELALLIVFLIGLKNNLNYIYLFKQLLFYIILFGIYFIMSKFLLRFSLLLIIVIFQILIGLIFISKKKKILKNIL